nr:putative baculovirus IAP repeat-like protein [Salmonid herpesvirus 1]
MAQVVDIQSLTDEIVSKMEKCAISPDIDTIEAMVAKEVVKRPNLNASQKGVIAAAIRRKAHEMIRDRERKDARNLKARETRAAAKATAAKQPLHTSSDSSVPYYKPAHKKQYPGYTGRYSLEEIINAGLFPIGKGDACQCKQCGVIVEAFDSRSPRHRHLLEGDPQCMFLKAEIYGGNAKSQLMAVRGIYMKYLSHASMISTEVRAKTFSDGAPPQPRQKALANKGYYQRDDEVVCAGCGEAHLNVSKNRLAHPKCVARLAFLEANKA